jgi:hypothetical protein
MNQFLLFLVFFGPTMAYGRLLGAASNGMNTTGTFTKDLAGKNGQASTHQGTMRASLSNHTVASVTSVTRNTNSTKVINTTMVNNTTKATNSSNPEVLIGGYSNIPNLNNTYVQKAAAYAVKELVKSNFTRKYNFLSNIQRPNAQYSWKVVRGKQQVVSGKNYKLTIKFLGKYKHCIGGLQVVVYDHFGNKTVTNWGKKVRCMNLMM